jgi:hypothetical protein
VQKVIKIYVKGEPAAVSFERGYENITPGHECWGRKPVIKVKTESVLPDGDEKALRIVEEICNETRAEFKVYNINTFKGRIQARLRGVKKTPTIVIGSSKIESVLERSN